MTPMAGPISTSRTASRSPRSATPIRGSRPRSTPRSTGSSGRSRAIGFTRADLAPRRRDRGDVPDPLDSVMFLNSGSEAIDGALKLARRVTGRPGIIAFRGGFHGRTLGRHVGHDLEHQLPDRATTRCCPASQFDAVPGRLRDFDGDDERRDRRPALAILRSLFATVIPPSAVAGDPHRAGPGRGRVRPGAAGVPARAARDLRRARHPAHRRRGPVGLRPDRDGCGRFEHAGIVPDVVVLAKSIANGLPLSAIVSSRDLQERWGRGAHGSTYARQPGRVRGRAGGPRDDPRGGPASRTPAARGAELRAGLERIAAEDDRIGDVRGPGPDDRRRVRARPRHARAGRRAAGSADAPPARTPACWC